MNRTKKLRGGVKLTQMERARLSAVRSDQIAGKVRDMIDSLKVIIESGKKVFKPDEKEKLDLLAKSTYEEYIETFRNAYTGKDVDTSINTAKGLDLLKKHFDNVKVLVKTLLENIKQEEELTRLKSQLPVPPAVKSEPDVKPQPVPVIEPTVVEPQPVPVVASSVVEPSVVKPEPAKKESTIVDNLLAEIDILKSELVSKDITLEEKNRLIASIKSLEEFKRTKTKIIDADRISFPNKCLNCSVVTHCVHKTGKFNKITLPYSYEGYTPVVIEESVLDDLPF
jgi:hypothetical protein